MRAFVVEHDDGAVTAQVRDVDPDAYLEGDVTVEVAWSCLNFKDAMVVRASSPVARRSPLIGGVDAAGVVVASADPSTAVGTRVVAHGHGFGTAWHGGFASTLGAQAATLTALPAGLDARTAMVYGTAGYTAMASVAALERHGLVAGDEVLVTGASGGVGSIAVALLAARGMAVTAMSGKDDEHAWLGSLGALRVIGRDGLVDRPERVLGSERFAGAVDCVGGEVLAQILRTLRWGGAVVASGLVGGAGLATTVYPFITRNVALLGIDSVAAPPALRAGVWSELVGALPTAALDALVRAEVGLDGIADGLAQLERGSVRGRILVDPAG